jgi:hypothetical protein
MSGKNKNKTKRVDGRVDGKGQLSLTFEYFLIIWLFGNISENNQIKKGRLWGSSLSIFDSKY